MKKVSFVFLLSLLGFCVFSQSKSYKTTSEAEKKFIRGSIADKIDVVTSCSEEEAYKMGLKGIEYSLNNAEMLGSDSELTSLVVASSITMEKRGNLDSLTQVQAKDLSDKLIKCFNLFEDETVKINVLQCLARIEDPKWNGTVDMLNDFLELRVRNLYPSNTLTGNVINDLGNFGDSRSFTLVYNIWVSKMWPEFASITESALMRLAQTCFEDTTKMIFFTDNSIISSFLELMKKSENISQNFRSNTAEIALLYAINNAESLQVFDSTFVSIQLECLKILGDSAWAHAEEVVLKNFNVAKKEYALGMLSDEEFIMIITSTAKFASSKVAVQFSNLLAELNGKAEKTELPSEAVVLALIKKLGELGDKAAFDNLLYVTYLNYPAKIKDAAKDSLQLLKW